jgi:hypothetical protein
LTVCNIQENIFIFDKKTSTTKKKENKPYTSIPKKFKKKPKTLINLYIYI